MRGFLVCGFEELPGFLTRAAIAELTGGSALMEKEYVAGFPVFSSVFTTAS